MHQAKFPEEVAYRGFEFGLNMGKTNYSRLRLRNARAWYAE